MKPTSDMWPVTSDEQDAGPRATSSCHPPPVTRRRSAFTLMEIMIVVAIIGLIAAMGVPSMLLLFRKEGMRKALSDMTDVCSEARARAILQNQTTAVVFHPGDRSFAVEGGGKLSSGKVTSATLPDGIEFAMLDINLMDFSQSDFGRVRFFPNGTSDEMTIVLHSRDDWRKITLEFSTGLTFITDVDR